ncbi:MAG: peptidylprolyl isomerase [Candidatus Moraniibacteriota bacterium]
MALIVLLFTVSLVLFYAVPRGHSARFDKSMERFPYPVALIGLRGGVITERELIENVVAVRRFYETQDFSQIGLRVDFSTADGEKRLKVKEKEIFNKMIEDKASVALGRQYGIRVTPDEAHQGVERTLAEYGTKDTVTSDLGRLYGWSLADFEEKVVAPSLYQEKLQAVFKQETQGAADQSKERIEEAAKELASGKSFADVARQYSEGQTASEGGALGWFRLEDLAPELQTALPLQKVGTPGSIVESVLGYHIVLVEETKNENGTVLYRLSQIFARKADFGDWFKKKVQGMHVLVLSPEYRWSQDEVRADFRDQELGEFEKKVYESETGDPLFLF